MLNEVAQAASSQASISGEYKRSVDFFSWYCCSDSMTDRQGRTLVFARYRMHELIAEHEIKNLSVQTNNNQFTVT